MNPKTFVKKAIEKTQDTYYLYKHTNMLHHMIQNHENVLLKRSQADKNLITIAFYPTGGFGDYIISSALLDELMAYGPIRADVFCENVAFGKAVYEGRPCVRVLPYDAYEETKTIYDIALTVEHFVHVNHYNAKNVVRLAPALADKMHQLGKSMADIRPEIDQQWFREAMHFERCRLKGINRWTELNHVNVFHIREQRSAVLLRKQYRERVKELGLEGKKYITINRGADSMGRSTMQTKVWPEHRYEEFIRLFKKQYPKIQIIQLGSKTNTKIKGADRYVLGENLETIKWILKGSIFHLDCEGGLVHLGTQLDTKCVVLFGPTPHHIYAYPQNINIVSKFCSNCMGSHKDWAFSCYRGYGRAECMEKITAEQVMERIKDWMETYKVQTQKQTIDLNAYKLDKGELEEEKKKLSALCRSIRAKHPLVEYREENFDRYLSAKKYIQMRKSEDEGDEIKVVVMAGGRDILPWLLKYWGAEVTVFDETYGWSGKIRDVKQCLYRQQCMEEGIDARIGGERDGFGEDVVVIYP